MLSQPTILKLDSLYEAQDRYLPGEEIRQYLGTKVAVLVVGATCQGKNTVMEAVVADDKRFRTIGTIVSRPPRDSDAGLPYTYYQNSDEGLRPILDDIDHRRVVQYAVNPYSRFLYASKLEDYPGEYNIGDYFSSAVAPFRTLGFMRAPAVTVISPLEDWLERFDLRFPIGHSDRQARRDEAVESISWSLAQTTDHYWVINRTDHPEQAARQLIDAITTDAVGATAEAQEMALATLEAARKLAV